MIKERMSGKVSEKDMRALSKREPPNPAIWLNDGGQP
jgi:hypothetical protein